VRRPAAPKIAEKDLHGHGPRHPVGLPGAGREQQVARLKAGALQGVHQAHAHGQGPAGVDAEQALGADLERVPPPEAQAAEPEQCLPQQELGEDLARAERHPEAQLRQDVPQHRQPLVDVAADQELLGGATLQLDGLHRRGPGHDAQVLLRGLGPAPRVGQGVAQTEAQLPLRGSVPGPQLQGQTIEARGAIESQGPGRPLGGGDGVAGRLLGLAPRLEVQGQPLGVRRPRSLEAEGQAAVEAGLDRRVQPEHHGLADAVVGLHLFPIAALAGACQAGPAQARECLEPGPRDLGGSHRGLEVHGLARHRHDLHQAARVPGQHRDPPRDQLLEAAASRAAVADQLVDEERAPGRLLDDGLDPLRGKPLLHQEPPGEVPGLAAAARPPRSPTSAAHPVASPGAGAP
jgi:hypothetical protein